MPFDNITSADRRYPHCTHTEPSRSHGWLVLAEAALFLREQAEIKLENVVHHPDIIRRVVPICGLHAQDMPITTERALQPGQSTLQALQHERRVRGGRAVLCGDRVEGGRGGHSVVSPKSTSWWLTQFFSLSTSNSSCSTCHPTGG
jgi:hypothetical protein